MANQIHKIVDGYNVIEYESLNIYIIENVFDELFSSRIINLIDKISIHKLSYSKSNNVECYISTMNELLDLKDEFFYKFSTDETKYNFLLNQANLKKRVSTNKLNGFTLTEIKKYNDEFSEKCKIINDVILKINNKINIQYNSGYILRKIYGPTRNHTDGITEVYDSNITFIKNNKIGDYRMIRNASIIFALNDDHDGGIFKFPYQNVSFKLNKGSVLIFPPYWTHPHEVSGLENDTFRYTISTWSCEKI